MSAFLRWHNTKLYIQNFNNDFLLLKGKENSKIAQIGTAIFHHNFDFIEEVIVTETEICLKLNTKFHIAKIGLLTTVQLEQKTDICTHTLPIYFKEHEDWQHIESFTGSNKQNIIAQLTTTDFEVAMFGFLPGFTYFKGLPMNFQIPRKAIPAKYVAANSLAIGGKYLGLYSIASPGGWYVIGKIPVPILQLYQLPPTTINLGDKIRLQAIGRDKYEELQQVYCTDA